MGNFLSVITACAISIPLLAKTDTVPDIVVRTDSPIQVQQLEDCGRIYTGHVAIDVAAGNGQKIAIPQGSPVELVIRETETEQMTVDIASITIKGRRYVIAEYDTGDESAMSGPVADAMPGGEQVQLQGAELHIPRQAVLRFRPPAAILLPACSWCM